MKVSEDLTQQTQQPTWSNTNNTNRVTLNNNPLLSSPTNSNESVSPLSTEPLCVSSACSIHDLPPPLSIPYLPTLMQATSQNISSFSTCSQIQLLHQNATAPGEVLVVSENETLSQINCISGQEISNAIQMEADASQEDSFGIIDFPMTYERSNHVNDMQYVTQKKVNSDSLSLLMMQHLPPCCIQFGKCSTITCSICISLLIALACIAFFVVSVYIYVRVDVGNFNIPRRGTLLTIQCNETTALCRGVIRIDASSTGDQTQPPPPDNGVDDKPIVGIFEISNTVLDGKTVTSEDEYPYDCNVWNDAKRGIYSISCYFNKNLSKMTLYPVVNFDDQALLISSCVMIVFIPLLCLLQNLLVIRWLCCGNIHCNKNKQNYSSS
ncbi:hypothetical protein FDP41_011590 [Naegleria fowleri]|uniref:Uncharacterized protein n=1 Tax=Naegleria fowleri TaxID=5763 RepID=A0A6A5CAF4_NAEFO|nr:uncharacterized protein FDP41_011590 [Naegleria fowleri]KAF0982660.1 hypothetical protein FDP41_011590 [Naegleria fowleri]CAG4718622.1 unnamed protein product [Naegleria fowleri]